MSAMNPTIMLHGGTYFNFLNPEESPFTIQDIARALSRIPRFTGHTSKFLSVAQHSIHVATLVPGHLRMQGLLHDAHEAFVGDMPTPLKILCPDYKIVEMRCAHAVRQRFGVPLESAPEVKVADLIALATEKALWMHPNMDEWKLLDDVIPRCDIINGEPWGHEEAYERFIFWFEELGQVGQYRTAAWPFQA